MNKTFAAFLCCTALAAAVSCQKEIFDEDGGAKAVKGNVVTLSVGTDGTKVHSSGTVTKWNSSEENMCVLALSGDSIARYKFTKPATSTVLESAEFSCAKVDEGATLKYAIYPWHDGDYSLGADETLHLYLANSTSCALANSIPGGTQLAGKINGTAVTMKSPCAYLKLTLPTKADGTELLCYKAYKIAAEGVAGHFDAIFEDDSLAVKSKGDLDYISVTPKRDKKTDTSSGAVYIPVIPGEYSDIEISLSYRDSLFDTWKRTSTKTQTFKSNKVYDCGTFAGPYAESAVTGACAVSGTTLTMNGSAVVWKYAGVTNDDYSFSFLYREENAADTTWNEVAATPDGTSQSVSFSADVTIDPEKTYEYKARVLACRQAVEGLAMSSGLKTVEVCIDFSQCSASTFTTKYNWVYDTENIEVGQNIGSDSKGNVIFPSTNPNGTTAFYYKTWNGSEWSESIMGQGTKTDKKYLYNIVGGSFSTKDSLGNKYAFYIPSSSSSNYYSLAGNKFCNAKLSSIKICCPEGMMIVSVNLAVKAGTSKTTFTWGLGDAKDTANLVPMEDHSAPANEALVPFNLVVPTPALNKDLWLYGRQRIGTLTVTYQY